jgi:hypothetical protein
LRVKIEFIKRVVKLDWHAAKLTLFDFRSLLENFQIL